MTESTIPSRLDWLGRTKWKASAIATGLFLLIVALIKLVSPLYRAQSAAMAPTVLSGDGVAVFRYAYRSHAPRRGDVVAFRHRQSTLLFRVVGLPGETVEIRSKRLFVDGVQQADSFAVHRDDRLSDHCGFLRGTIS